MENMFFNGARYFVEFIKLLLAACILNIRIKKEIPVVFAISLIGVFFLSHWFDLSEYSILYGVIAFAVFLITLYKKRQIGLILLSYIGISLIDMLFAILCTAMFHLTMSDLQEEPMLFAALNSISLVPLLVLSAVSGKIKKKKKNYALEISVPAALTGGLILSAYLTYVLFIGLGAKPANYQKEFMFSSVAVMLFIFFAGYLTLKKRSENQRLKVENSLYQRLLKAQDQYYSMLLKKETETKMFRHDIREHIMSMQMLYDRGEYEEMGEYLKQMDTYTKELSPKVVTGSPYVDMIEMELSEQFPDVKMNWKGKIPELHMTSMDLCTLFYNLLSNAFESAHRVPDRSVRVLIKTQGTNFMILVSNHFEKLNRNANSQFMTTKKEEGHGYGLKNIEMCVEKYKGSYLVTTEEGVFCTEVILPDVIKKN